ncbi:MAG: rhodanese-like domain-containing protein [Actinobacteria bacterium]|nr:rhodanese-like domain-containing protein [Actinomycetota bacterium]
MNNTKNSSYYFYVILLAIMILAASFFLFSCSKNDSQKSQDTLTSNSNLPASSNENTSTQTSSQEVASTVSQDTIKNVSADEVFDMLKDKNKYFLLDVRNKNEYTEGHLENSILIPVNELEKRISEISTDKPIIVYCKSGNRSTQAAQILAKSGFTQIYNMTGGITEWIAKGYPVVK